MTRNPRDAVELLPAPAAIRGAIDPRRFGPRELRAHEAKRRRREPGLDALPRRLAAGAAEQPIAVRAGQQRRDIHPDLCQSQHHAEHDERDGESVLEQVQKRLFPSAGHLAKIRIEPVLDPG